MLIDEISMKELKSMLFEIYSAGFEAGYTKEIDIVKAYNQYWNNLIKRIKE